MKRGIVRAALAAVSLLVPYVSGAQAMFMQAEGISGTSTNDRYIGWNDINYVTWAGGIPVAGGRASPDPIRVYLKPGVFSQKLMEAMYRGQVLRNVNIDMQETGRYFYVRTRLELSNVVITKVQNAVATTSFGGNTELELTYSRVKWTERALTADGTTGPASASCFDFKLMMAC